MYAAQAKVGRPFGTMLQIRQTAIANREYCKKNVNLCKSRWQEPGRGWLPQISAFKWMFQI